jgi:hypothetical protein
LAAVLLIATASLAGAQTYEAVGTRAQGMAGAFVAVADDATATWWNPAGLATGSFLSALLEHDTSHDPSTVPPSGPARRETATGFAIAFPALGLSYYRLRVSEIAPITSTVAGVGVRQDQGVAAVPLRSLAYSQFGVSFGQSLGNHLVVGSTLKLLHGGSAATVDVAAGTDSLDRAAKLDTPSESHGDLDAGAMATFGVARLGVSLKHLTEPVFGEGADRFELTRQARAGGAIIVRSSGIVRAITLAVDADLTRTATALGDVRHVALGVEAWLFRNRFGIRGGVSRNTIDDARQSASAGGSLAFANGTYVDGAFTGGSDRSRTGWSLALRKSF